MYIYIDRNKIMGIKKGLALGAAALALNAAEGKSSNLPDITENTKKAVQENIVQNRSAKQKDILREEATKKIAPDKGKTLEDDDQEKIEKTKSTWS